MEDLSDNSKSTIQSLFNNLDLEEKKGNFRKSEL